MTKKRLAAFAVALILCMSTFLVACKSADAKTDNTAITTVTNLINAIPATITDRVDFETKLNAAEAAFNALDEKLQPKVTNRGEIAVAKTKLANFKAVQNVIDLINAIPDTVTAANRTAVEDAIKAAKDAHTALASALKGDVTNFAKIGEAEGKLKEYNDGLVPTAVQTLIGLVDAITVEVTEANYSSFKTAVSNTESTYASFSTTLKARPDVIALQVDIKVADAKNRIIAYENGLVINPVILVINAIPTGSVTAENRADFVAKIAKARGDYNKLTQQYKDLIPADTVAQIEAAQNKVDAYDIALAEHNKEQAVQGVITTISLIPITLAVTADKAVFVAFITDAKVAYANLLKAYPTIDVSRVTNYGKIAIAEAQVADYDLAKPVYGYVIDIPSGDVTAENRTAYVTAIKKAQDAYGTLSQSQKALVTNFPDIKAAQDKVDAYDVGQVRNLIAEILELEENGSNIVAYFDSILAAKDAYDKLRDDLRTEELYKDIQAAFDVLANYEEALEALVEMVVNAINKLDTYDVISGANRQAFEDDINTAKSTLGSLQGPLEYISEREEITDIVYKIGEAQTKLDNYDISVVVGKITAIGEIDATFSEGQRNDFQARIGTAETAYYGLREDLRGDLYAGIQAAKDALADYDIYVVVYNVIAGIEVPEEITAGNRDALQIAINNAKNDYNNLGVALQPKVTNYGAIVETIQGMIDTYDVKLVDGLIKQIGVLVNVNSDSTGFADRIQVAKDALGDLRADLQSDSFKNTIAVAEKNLADYIAAKAAQAQIIVLDNFNLSEIMEDFGNGELTEEQLNKKLGEYSVAAVHARAAYDVLSIEAEDMLADHSDYIGTLTTAEQELVNFGDELVAAGQVISMIAMLPTITERAHVALVEQARVAYDNLTIGTVFVYNEDKLLAAEAKVIELEVYHENVALTSIKDADSSNKNGQNPVFTTTIAWTASIENGFGLDEAYEITGFDIEYTFNGLKVIDGKLTDTLSDIGFVSEILAADVFNHTLNFGSNLGQATGKLIVNYLDGDSNAKTIERPFETTVTELRLYNFAYARANDYGAVEMFSYSRNTATATVAAPIVQARGHTIVNYNENGNGIELYGATFSKGHDGFNFLINSNNPATQAREWYYDGDGDRLYGRSSGGNTNIVDGTGNNAAVTPSTTASRWADINSVTTNSGHWNNFASAFNNKSNKFSYVPYNINEDSVLGFHDSYYTDITQTNNAIPSSENAPSGLLESGSKGRLALNTDNQFQFTFRADGELAGNNINIPWAGDVTFSKYFHSVLTFFIDSSMKFVKYIAFDNYEVDSGMGQLGMANTRSHANMNFVYHEKNVDLQGHAIYRVSPTWNGSNKCDCVGNEGCKENITSSSIIPSSEYKIDLDWTVPFPEVATPTVSINNLTTHPNLLSTLQSVSTLYYDVTSNEPLVVDLAFAGGEIDRVRKGTTALTADTQWSYADGKLTILPSGMLQGNQTADGARIAFDIRVSTSVTTVTETPWGTTVTRTTTREATATFYVAFPRTSDTLTAITPETEGNIALSVASDNTNRTYTIYVYNEAGQLMGSTLTVASVRNVTSFNIAVANVLSRIGENYGTYTIVYGVVSSNQLTMIGRHVFEYMPINV